MNSSSKSLQNRQPSILQSDKLSSNHSLSAKKMRDPDSNVIDGERLLKDDESQLDIYDPFESPPNFLKAQRHHEATSIGIPHLQKDTIKDIEVCPCCENPIRKQPISVCCKQDELLFLGVGYPLYFKLAKYIAYMVLFVFFVSGSGLYYLVNGECKDDCLYFFGFVIINFDPPQGEDRAVEFMNMATAIGIFAFALYIKSLLNNDINTLESKVICPSQYTIMLQNLPKNFEQYELKKWIKQTFQSQCVSLNVAYNVQQIQRAYQKRNNLTIELRKLWIKRNRKQLGSARSIASQPYPQNYMYGSDELQYDKQRQLSQQIQKCDRVISDYKNNVTDCEKNGSAFATFESVQTVINLLEKYEQTEMSNFFSQTMYTVLKHNRLQFMGRQLFQLNDRVVKISRAPAPREVIWQNLSYSYFKSVAFQLFFMMSMLLLIYFAFQYQFKFSAYAYQLRTQVKQSGEKHILFQAVVVSLIVILLNSLLRLVIYIFTKLKRYHSYTSQQSSFCFYYTLMYVFNSCFMIYIVHGQYPQESNQLLLFDIHFILLANAFSQPLFKLCDPIMWHKVIMKRYITSLPPDRNPYTQMYVHKYYEGHEISNGDNYQYLARILIVTIWFAHAAPLGVMFCLIGMLVDYWIGKVLLLKEYKKPQIISKSIATFIINSFQLLPLVYICGVLQYTYKSTSSNASIVEFLLNFFNYSITVSVLIISILGYLIFFKNNTIVVSKTPYSDIKNYFGFNYETQNPVTKFRGQMNYLQNIMKSLNRGAWMNVHSKEDIAMINQLSRSPQDLDKQRLNMAKIKLKMEIVNEIDYTDELEEEIQLNDLSDKDKRDVSDRIRESSSIGSDQQKEPKRKTRKGNFFLKRTNSIFV